jgi:hypothetical protein
LSPLDTIWQARDFEGGLWPQAFGGKSFIYLENRGLVGIGLIFDTIKLCGWQSAKEFPNWVY